MEVNMYMVDLNTQHVNQEEDLNARQNVDIVYRRLREAILNGQIPADVILSQVQLAQQIGVSRTPLREALRMLQREGLIEAELNRRVRVTGLSIGDLEQIYAARITLEALGIRLTIPNLSNQDLHELEKNVNDIEKYSTLADYDRWLEPHRSFHNGIVSYSGKRLVTQMNQLSDHAERYRRVYTLETPGAWITGVEEHRSILNACLAREPVAAADRLARHYAHMALSVIARVAPEHEPTVIRIALRMAVQMK
jgi:DNA-binding GntR family transcriptional regulator